MKRHLKYSFFTLVILLVFLMLLNAALWLFVYRKDPMNRIFTHDPYRLYRVESDLDLSVPVGENAKGLWRGSGERYSLRTNRYGFRSEDLEVTKKGSELRLVFLGDSITFGWDVEDDQAFPRLFAKAWQRQNPEINIELINAGAPGQSSWQGLILLVREILRLKPDLVVVEFGIADSASSLYHWGKTDREIMQGSIETGWKKIEPYSFTGIMLRLQGQPVFYMFRKIFGGLMWAKLYRQIERGRGTARPEGGLKFTRAHVPPSDYMSNLVDFIALSKKHGFGLVFFIPYGVPREYEEATLKIARMHRIPVIDLSQSYFQVCREAIESEEKLKDELERYSGILGAETMKKHDYLDCTTDGGHPNTIGHIVIAEQLEKLLLEGKEQVE